MKFTIQEIDPLKIKREGHSIESRIPLVCSACEAPLINVVVTKPDWPIEADYIADCPHCGDHSYTKHIRGGVMYEMTEDSPYSKPVKIEPGVGKVKIRMVVGKPWQHGRVGGGNG